MKTIWLLVACLLPFAASASDTGGAYKVREESGWLRFPLAMEVEEQDVVSRVELMFRGERKSLRVETPVPPADSDPKSIEACWTEFMAAVLSKDFQRYAAVTAPREARDAEGKVLSTYRPETGPSGFELCTFMTYTGWATGDYLLHVGSLSVIPSQTGTTYFATGKANVNVCIDAYPGGHYGFGLIHWTDKTDFGNKIAEHIRPPEDNCWAVSTEQPHLSQYDDHIKGDLSYHEISFDRLFGDEKNEYPVKLSFWGGPLRKDGPYAAVYDAWSRVRKAGLKLASPRTPPFDSSLWSEYLSLFDEQSQCKLLEERQDVENHTGTFFHTRIWGDDLIYLIDAGPLYVLISTDTDSEGNVSLRFCAVLKHPQGYRFTGYRSHTLFDQFFGSAEIQDKLAVIIVKEVPDVLKSAPRP